MALAGFEAEEEMAAIDLYGMMAADGLALSASAAVDLVAENISSVNID